MNPFGISVALLTPFAASGEIDGPMLGAHAKSMMDHGAHGVTLYGTTGEGASIGMNERRIGLDALKNAGIPEQKITLGICATSLSDAVDQIKEGLSRGIRQFLVLPPFYFKGCEDEGLFEWHIALAHAAPQASLILYHIPQVSAVPLSLDLVGRLKATEPDRFVAIKDSSGDWNNTKALLEQNALDVLVGDERHLQKALTLGAAGSICGTANLYPERLLQLYDSKAVDQALCDHVAEIVSLPVIPALKSLLADQCGNTAWKRVRPPLQPLAPPQEKDFLAHAKL